ncbi:MAG TPA: 1-deoxy-D-xylulose-5-phosphate reductoisomerase [Bacteroidales bacterium]
MKKRIAILGSTGSIGRQTLEVIKEQSNLLDVEVLTAMNNADLLIQQAIEFKPNAVVIGNETHYKRVKSALDPLYIKVFAGEAAISQVLEMESIDLVLLAISGFAGLKPALAALENKKPLALANKECLVAAGELVKKAALSNNTPVIPVDSEASAIFQCLSGEGNNPVDKVVLTASGGPFRSFSKKEIENVSPKNALNNPNWLMSDKITIDSASLMNKGLEAIEARWLFNLKPEQIEVVIHAQSIVHSLVYFADGSVKAQLSQPDMRIPIQYAITYPARIENKLPRLDLLETGSLTFEKPDTKKFRNLALAFEALEKGGNMPCILNAANEIAVQAFLNKQIKFIEIPQLVEMCLQEMVFIKNPVLADILETDRLTRLKAQETINKKT